jgi:NADP-dependent 3-hydroxy acid dehydrogenase YdfG
MTTLKDKVVLITGASSGFGAAAAKLFAQEGCRIALAARRMERLAEIANEIRGADGDALPVVVDVTQPAQIEPWSTVMNHMVGSIFSNNAGLVGSTGSKPQPIEDIQGRSR